MTSSKQVRDRMSIIYCFTWKSVHVMSGVVTIKGVVVAQLSLKNDCTVCGMVIEYLLNVKKKIIN
jgi:hypothetical protein